MYVSFCNQLIDINTEMDGDINALKVVIIFEYIE